MTCADADHCSHLLVLLCKLVVSKVGSQDLTGGSHSVKVAPRQMGLSRKRQYDPTDA